MHPYVLFALAATVIVLILIRIVGKICSAFRDVAEDEFPRRFRSRRKYPGDFEM